MEFSPATALVLRISKSRATALCFLFLGYLLIAFFSLVTLHNRKERALGPSQWFLLAALFWFPWIYFTANYLLVVPCADSRRDAGDCGVVVFGRI